MFNSELLESKWIYINDRRYLNIRPLLQVFRSHPEYLEILEPKFHSLVMGDTNTENIKIGNIQPILDAMKRGDANFTAEDIGIKFIDPRAIGFHENGADTGADIRCTIINPGTIRWEIIDDLHGEHFGLSVLRDPRLEPRINITFDPDSPYRASYTGIEKYFKPVMTNAWGLDEPDSEFLKQDPYWVIRFVFLMGTHFTAMPPFHFKTDITGTMIDDDLNQRRPVAIYAEGIKWLNMDS